MLIRSLILLILFAFLGVNMAAQSPWARSKAGFYAQLGYHTIPTYTTLFGSGSSDIEMIREVSEQTLQFYGEYGLSSKTTFAISLPYRFNSRGARNPNNPYFFAKEDTGSISGLGNTSMAIRHQFLTGKTAFAGNLRVDLPSDKSQPLAGLQTGFDALTIQPSVSVGMGLGQFYWQAYGGIAFRTNNYSHFVNAGGEAGWKLGPVWLIGFTDAVFSLENGSQKLTPLDALTGLYVNDQGWLSFGLKGIWEINRFVGIVVSGAGVAWAQYVPKSPGLTAAVYFKWD